MTGGFGSAVLEAIAEAGAGRSRAARASRSERIGLPGDRFVDHGSVGPTCGRYPARRAGHRRGRSASTAAAQSASTTLGLQTAAERRAGTSDPARRHAPDRTGRQRAPCARHARVRARTQLLGRARARRETRRRRARAGAAARRAGSASAPATARGSTASRRAGRPGDRRSRWSSGRASCRAAARSWTRRWSVRGRPSRVACAWTSARRPAASPTCCCGAARRASMLSTWDADSWRSRCAGDPRVVSMERTHARRLDPRPRRSRDTARAGQPGGHRRLVHLADARAQRSRGRARRRAARSWRWSSPSSRRCQPTCRGRGAASRPFASAMVDKVAESRSAIGLAGPRQMESPLARPGGQPRVPAPSRSRADAPHRLRLQPDQAEALELRDRAMSWCARCTTSTPGRASRASTPNLIEELPDTDGLVVLGGDGTFLRAARAIAASTCPSWASTPARSGSCPRSSRRHSSELWPMLVGGKYAIEPRMMLEATRPPRRRATAPAESHRRAQRRGDRARRRGARRAPGGDRSTARTWPPTSPTASSSPRPPARPPTRSAPAARSSTRPPQPDRDADRRLPVVDPLDRRRPRPHRARVAWSRRRLGWSASTAARTMPLAGRRRGRDQRAERPIRFIEPRGALPFWELLRQKAALLPA